MLVAFNFDLSSAEILNAQAGKNKLIDWCNLIRFCAMSAHNLIKKRATVAHNLI